MNMHDMGMILDEEMAGARAQGVAGVPPKRSVTAPQPQPAPITKAPPIPAVAPVRQQAPSRPLAAKPARATPGTVFSRDTAYPLAAKPARATPGTVFSRDTAYPLGVKPADAPLTADPNAIEVLSGRMTPGSGGTNDVVGLMNTPAGSGAWGRGVSGLSARQKNMVRTNAAYSGSDGGGGLDEQRFAATVAHLRANPVYGSVRPGSAEMELYTRRTGLGDGSDAARAQYARRRSADTALSGAQRRGLRQEATDYEAARQYDINASLRAQAPRTTPLNTVEGRSQLEQLKHNNDMIRDTAAGNRQTAREASLEALRNTYAEGLKRLEAGFSAGADARKRAQDIATFERASIRDVATSLLNQSVEGMVNGVSGKVPLIPLQDDKGNPLSTSDRMAMATKQATELIQSLTQPKAAAASSPIDQILKKPKAQRTPQEIAAAYKWFTDQIGAPAGL